MGKRKIVYIYRKFNSDHGVSYVYLQYCEYYIFFIFCAGYIILYFRFKLYMHTSYILYTQDLRHMFLVLFWHIAENAITPTLEPKIHDQSVWIILNLNRSSGERDGVGKAVMTVSVPFRGFTRESWPYDGLECGYGGRHAMRRRTSC
jgi:hypothetical protein